MIQSQRNILIGPQWKTLSDTQIEDIHFASLEVLERTGVKVAHQKMRKLLHEAGARVDEASQIVKLPAALVEWALRTAPSKITVYDRLGNVAMSLEDHKVYFGNSVDCLYFLDPKTGTNVKSKREHVPLLTRLADALENIDFINPGGMIRDVPLGISNRLVFKDVVMNTTMPIVFDPRSAKELEQIIHVCEIVAGGADRFSERPFLLAYFEPISPLFHPEDMIEILFLAAERCIPIVYTTMSIGGATGPITLSGNLALCNAEVLSSITIAQLIREGLPCVYGGIPGPMDMRTTRFAYGSPESMLLCAAFTDLAHYYNLPMFGTAGVTDAVEVDCQAATEIALNCFLAVMSGANLVHDIAQFAGGDSSSMEGMVLADEIIAMLRHITQPIDTSPEALALDLIDSVGPCGNYLAEKHTVQHHRAIWHPTIFNRVGLERWFENPRRVSQNLKHKVEEILEKHQPIALDDRVIAQLEQIEESWWREGKLS